MGVEEWNRDLLISELFCGRGNALRAWQTLGFRHLEGLDVSWSQVSQYEGPANVLVGDARSLPWPDETRSVIAV